jgi:hypothetical protein
MGDPFRDAPLGGRTFAGIAVVAVAFGTLVAAMSKRTGAKPHDGGPS